MLLSALRLALMAILRNKTRAALTVLGILIGVAAVVTVTALSASATNQISGQISGLGANLIYIFPQATQVSGARNKGVGKLTEGDGRALLRESVSVAEVAPFLSTVAQVVNGDKNTATSICGSNLSYFTVRQYKIERGSAWTLQDEQTKAKVCVLGATTADTLFGSEDPIGRTIRIGRSPHRVVGVLARKGTSPFGEDQDDRILMPIGSFRSRIMPTSPGRVDMLMASASSAQTTDRASRQIEAILRQRHHMPDDRDPDFSIRTQAELQAQQEGITTALRALLLGVAAISLLVGGIGVMNIMLVSVAERTREIGIRMSIGAREADILVQFLIEALVLSLIGGVLGSLLGGGAVIGLGRALDWPMAPSAEALAVALATSATIGVVFGYLPARRAAKMDPIDALRSD